MTPPKASDQVRCPRGHLTSGKFPFCTECGAELNPQGGDEGGVRCPNGHLVTGGHRFCIECGAPVEAPADAPDEPTPQPLADTDGDDVAEADEVRCPKGHLTPSEYPYCIICGAELDKAAAAAAPAAPPPAAKPTPRAKRTVRRRPRAPVVETPPTDESDEPDATEEVATPARRPPRLRRPARPPVPQEEPEEEDEDDFLVEDVPPIVTMDEPEEEEDEEDEPFLAPVPSYTAAEQRDESAEHFVHTPSGPRPRERVGRPGFDKQKWVIPIAAGVLAVVALVVVVLLLRNSGGPSAAPTPLPTAIATTAPVSAAPTATPQPTAAGPNANVPMTVASPTVRTTGTSYTASATLRNPTDFTAKNITVTFNLKDASGAVIGTVTRTIAALAPGGNVVVSVSGADPGGKQPTSADARAVAAQISG